VCIPHTNTAGNTHAPQTFANLLKVYYNLALELAANPAARERYAAVGRTKALVAIGADEPIGGDKHVATYFVSILSSDGMWYVFRNANAGCVMTG
jgi:hypothetical protein